MADILRGEKLTAGDFLRSLADEHAVHNDVAAWFKIDRGEFVFCRDVFGERVIVFVVGDRFSGLKRKKRNDDVVARVEFQGFTRSLLARPFHVDESSSKL